MYRYVWLSAWNAWFFCFWDMWVSMLWNSLLGFFFEMRGFLNWNVFIARINERLFVWDVWPLRVIICLTLCGMRDSLYEMCGFVYEFYFWVWDVWFFMLKCVVYIWRKCVTVCLRCMTLWMRCMTHNVLMTHGHWRITHVTHFVFHDYYILRHLSRPSPNPVSPLCVLLYRILSISVLISVEFHNSIFLIPSFLSPFRSTGRSFERCGSSGFF